MTRNLFITSFLLFITTIVLIVVGFSSAALGAVALGLLCVAPFSFMALGAAMARFTLEFEISRKTPVIKGTRTQTVRSGQVLGQ